MEAVVVGEAALDDHVRALVAACGEGTLNAARRSGSREVSVYVEVEDGAISAFVRDHGTGFDPAAMRGDRRGIADSIVGRLQRHGGSAQVHSQVVGGTEVVLQLPMRRRDGPRLRGRRPRAFPVRRARRTGQGPGDCGQCRHCSQGDARTLEHDPDVVLLDVHMPAGGGRIHAVRAGGGTARFLVLSVSDAAGDVIGVIRAGARAR